MFAAITNNRVVDGLAWGFNTTVSGLKTGTTVTFEFAKPYLAQGSAWAMRQPVAYQFAAAVVLTAVLTFAAIKISAAYSKKEAKSDVKITDPEQKKEVERLAKIAQDKKLAEEAAAKTKKTGTDK